jgi:GGDEF domain-containing protein
VASLPPRVASDSCGAEDTVDIFDKVNQQTLNRRDRQLSILALVMILILAGGMALLMYPAVFGKAGGTAAPPSRTLFFGFCGLSILLVAYLVNRQYVVQQLRTKLLEEKEETARLQAQSSAELLETLPGFSHFQDRLIMDFRRASQTEEPLSLILVRLNPSPLFARGPQAQVASADAAKVLSRKLRAEDSLYRLSSTAFGLILPATSQAAAEQAADRLSEGLAGASGASNRFAAEIQVVNYPEHVTSASDMERHAAALVSEG